MSRATPLNPARLAAIFAAILVTAVGAVLSLGAPSADAASKPCWKRVLDDYADNARMDGVYPATCLQQAIDHLPEDLRIYSDAPERIKDARQSSGRRLQAGSGGGGTTNPTKKTQSNAQSVPVKEVEPKVALRDPGPIPNVLNTGNTSADSIPLPLIVLAGLALLLMAAGATGIAARKVQARRVTK